MSEPLSENPQRQKPQRERQQYDDTDLRLNAALQAVDVPVGLRARLVQSVELASNELVAHELAAHELANQELATRELVPVELLNTNGLMNPAHVPSQTAGVTMQLETRFGPHAGKSRRLSRRSVIAAAIAAGIGGVVFGYRQLTFPVSQAWLVASTQNLLDQVHRGSWQDLSEAETIAVRRFLHEVGFSRQVPNASLVGMNRLHPPRSVKLATAYDLGNESILLDLTIERGVQHLSHSLIELGGSRSDLVMFAMSKDDRTLVLAGPPAIRKHILPAQTT